MLIMCSMRKRVQVGEKFEMLTVVSRVENYISPSGINFSQWFCKCDCGNQIKVLGSSLTSGHTKSCGCLSKQYKVNNDSMIGRKFGSLTVVSRAPSHKIPSGGVYDMWNCVCDCGQVTISFGQHLRKGRALSCGCQRVANQAMAKWTPKAENWTKEWFIDNNIRNIYQKTFPGLVGGKNYPLSFDFYLPDHNVLLELNGLQHYKAIDWFGGEKTFVKQQHLDELKRKFAKEHGYKLVSINTNKISRKKLFDILNTILT